jgi:hypothetical protein
MGDSLMFVLTRRMNSGFWLEVLAISTTVDIKASQQLSDLEPGMNVRLTLSMWSYNGNVNNNVVYAFTAAGADGSGNPVFGNIAGHFTKSYWNYRVNPGTVDQEYIGVIVQTAASFSYLPDVVTPTIDNVNLNWLGEIPIPMPCRATGYGATGYDFSSCDYPFEESGLCDGSCGRYSINFLSNNAICGITLPTNFLTYSRNGNVILGYAGDDSTYVNLTMEVLPDTCQVKITLLAASETNEIFAYGFGQLPDIGCSRVITMQVLLGCSNELFGIELACE